MRLKLSTIFLLLSSFLISCSQPLSGSSEAKTALIGLKKIGSQLDIGVTKDEYLKQIEDAKFAVEQFTETQESKDNPKFTEYVSKSLRSYLVTLELEKTGIEEDCWNKAGQQECQKLEDSTTLASIFKDYPEVKTDLEDLVNKAFNPRPPTSNFNSSAANYFFYDYSVWDTRKSLADALKNKMWAYAKEYTSKADSEFKN